MSRLTRGVCARRIGSCWCGIAVDRRLYRTALFHDWDCVRDRKEKLCLHALYLNENRIAGFYRVNFCSQAKWNGHCTESIILVWVKIADKYVRPIKIYGNLQIIFIMYTVREVFNTSYSNTSLDRMGWIIIAGTRHVSQTWFLWPWARLRCLQTATLITAACSPSTVNNLFKQRPS